MDRWSEQDTETGVGLDATPHALASRVTRLGLGGFVRADAGGRDTARPVREQTANCLLARSLQP